MQPVQMQEVEAAAEARSLELGRVGPPDAALDRLRADCLRFFEKVPEPPVYLRRDDPSRSQARELLQEGQELLARALSVGREPSAASLSAPLQEALRGHLLGLVHAANGRLGEAEAAWADALSLEDRATRAQRLWERSDEGAPPVYDRATGVSRYDPAPDPQVKVKLACPNSGCQRVEEYGFSPRSPAHELTCPRCHQPFVAYFAEVRMVGVTQQGQHLRHYVFRLEEAGGGLSRVEFDESSGAELRVARGDFLAFLYTPDRELRAVVDLSSTKLLWVTRGGPCFLATAAFGEGAGELAAFRAFRDRVLMRSAAGAWAVRWYYRVGPSLAAPLRERPRARAGVRWALARIHGLLKARGY
ncbi:MAG TPA: CFI-box-CTERM domain-containing protein [Myxococcaceae bacterium]|nr:CFI-box-CTERM domain-containing protein [Myxococcaceae bacterium]